MMTMLSDIMFDRCPSMKVDWVAHRGKMYTIDQIAKQKGEDKIILRVKNDQDELAFTLFDEVIDYTTASKHSREMLDIEAVGVDYPVSLIIDRIYS